MNTLFPSTKDCVHEVSMDTPEKFRGVSPLELGLIVRDAVTELAL